jgi:hypothetical protein
MRRLIMFAGIWLLTPTLVWADSATVASGVKSQITTHMRYDNQCKPSRVVIKVLAAPANGSVTSEPKGIVVQAQSARGVQQSSQCIGKTVPGVAIYYQSKPGFVGQDSFRYRRFNPDNDADRFNADISYTVTVK